MMLDTGFLILGKNKKRYSIPDTVKQASSIGCLIQYRFLV